MATQDLQVSAIVTQISCRAAVYAVYMILLRHGPYFLLVMNASLQTIILDELAVLIWVDLVDSRYSCLKPISRAEDTS